MKAQLNISDTCWCGDEKKPGALFCDPCFLKLPEDTRAEINVRIRDLANTNGWALAYLKTEAGK